MPHINPARGETVTFVFRREHAKLTHRTHYKSKRDSDRDIRVPENRSYRSQCKRQLHRDPSGESVLPPRKTVRRLR